MKITKKVLSLILSLAMVLSLCQIPTHAWMVDSAPKAKIKLVAMELKPGLAASKTEGHYDEDIDEDVQSNIKLADLQEITDISSMQDKLKTLAADSGRTGSDFYIGFKAEGFNKIEEYATYNLGISLLTFGLSFNSTYLLPLYDTGNTVTETNTALDTLMKSSRTITNLSNGSTTSKQTVLWGVSPNGTKVVDYDYSKVGTNGNNLFFSLAWEGTSSTPTYATSYVPQDGDIIGAIPVRMVTAPADGSVLKLVTMDDDRKQYALDMGIGTEDEEGTRKYQIPSSETFSSPATSEATDIKNVLEFDLSGIDFYPQSYSIKFYAGENDSTAIANCGKTNIADNTAFNTITGIVEPVPGTDFDSPRGDGKYFAGWKYKDKNNNECDYPDDLAGKTINDTLFADGETELKVYATWADPVDVKFFVPDAGGSFSSTASATEQVAPSNGYLASAPDVSADVPSGYAIEGWYDNQSYTGDPIVFGTAGDTPAPTDLGALATGTPKETKLYAKLIQGKTVIFVKDKDGSTTDDANVVQKTVVLPSQYPLTVTKPATDPTETGKTFAGWFNKSDDSAFPAAGITINNSSASETIVYAKWNSNVTVEYYKNATDAASGSNKLGTQTLTENTGTFTTTSYETDDATAHTYFNGWKNADGDTSISSGANRSINGKTFTAANVGLTDLNGVTTVKLYKDMKAGYTVKFYENDQTTQTGDTKYSNSVTPAALGSANMVTAPTVTGKKFDGWKVKTGTGTIATGSTFTDATVVDGNIEVYATYADKVSVKIYEDSTKNTLLKTIYLDDGKTTIQAQGETLPANPAARTGYRFDGWVLDGTSTAFTATTTVTSSVEVVGKWTQVYTVKIYDTQANAAAGGTTVGAGGLLRTVEVASGEAIPATDINAVKPATENDDTNHKYFNGWKQYVDGTNDTAFSTSTTITGDISIYQDWKDYYKVTFYKDPTDIAANTVYDTKYVNPHASQTTVQSMPTNPTKTGYGFTNWKDYTSGTFGSNFLASTPVTSDMTIVADWAEKAKITFHSNYGENPETSETTELKYATKNVQYDGGAPTTITRTGYTISSWNAERDGSGTSYPAALNTAACTFSGDTDLYAIWTPTNPANTWTLTLDPVGGTVTPTSISVVKGEKIYAYQVPTPTKTSASSQAYTFDGWFEEATLSNTTQFNFPLTLTDNDTAYAHWSYNGTDKITVNFDYDGATTPTGPASLTIAPGTSIGDAMPSDPVKANNDFIKWVDQSNTYATFDKNTILLASPTTVNVKASYDQYIRFTYDLNGGSGTAPVDQVKPKATVYVDPTDTSAIVPPTSSQTTPYRLVGWNTEANGSGIAVKGNGTKTYEGFAKDVDSTGNTREIVLYAQWAAVNSSGQPDPNQRTVDVTFDNNVPENTTCILIKGVNPDKKYPQLGDSMDTAVKMPASPERNHYKFVGWNTQADGTGVDVTGSTPITEAGLDGALVQNGQTFTLTLYAQWEVADDDKASEIILTFNRNLNSDGQDSKPIVYSVYSGDRINLANPTNGDKAFRGWFGGSVSNNKVTFDPSDKFDTTQPVTGSSRTYYAQWEYMLVVIIDQTQYDYDGQVKVPTYKIYTATLDASGNHDASHDYSSDTAVDSGDLKNENYSITYKVNNLEKELKDAGSYTADVQLTTSSPLYKQGAKIAFITGQNQGQNTGNTITIDKRDLDIVVDPDSQAQNAGDTSIGISLEVKTADGTVIPSDKYEVKYYKWTDDAAADGKLQGSELDSGTTTVPTVMGDYVVRVTLTDADTEANNEIANVKSLDNTKSLILYDGNTQGYPAFDDINVTHDYEKITYRVKANDPGANNITVQKVNKDDPTQKTNVDLKKDNYTDNKTFVSDETEEEDPTKKNHYWVDIDKDSDKVEITIKPEYDSTVPTANIGEMSEKQADGTYILTVPITNEGKTTTDIVITMTAGDGNTTRDYTFTVQKHTAVRIEMAYGNSPMGRVQQEPWSDALKLQVRTEFINNNYTFSKNVKMPDNITPAIPENLDGIKYTSIAWATHEADGTVPAEEDNMDLNEHALFIYQGEDFIDPGITAYDSLGDQISNPTVIMTMVVDKMNDKGVANLVDAKNTSLTITNDPDRNTDTTASFEDLKALFIRPGIYTLSYTVQDPLTNEWSEPVNRKVIMLWEFGDSNLSAGFNDSDASYVTQIVKKIVKPLGGDYGTVEANKVTGPVRNLYYYRIIDTNLSAGINDSDASSITQMVKRVIAKRRLYQPIPTPVPTPEPTSSN